MTASRFEQRGAVGLAAMIVLLTACGAPLPPPEPPGRDAADPAAPVPAYRPAADPLRTSAFEGQAPAAGHEHHGHGGHKGHGGKR